jgi:ribosomal-protein-alanine N-acetyltransferase
MRVYGEGKELVKVVCNACGKELLVENGILKDECIHVDHDFGFFGAKDGESEKFDLCEACYERLTADFQIPVERQERKELL